MIISKAIEVFKFKHAAILKNIVHVEIVNLRNTYMNVHGSVISSPCFKRLSNSLTWPPCWPVSSGCINGFLYDDGLINSLRIL